MKFTDSKIEELFGAEDAEGEPKERFKEYFVQNRAYELLTEDLPIRILVGHKGVGKSALLKRAFLDDEEQGRLAVFIQPSDIEALRSELPSDNINRVIEDWKKGIIKVIAKKSAERMGSDSADAIMRDEYISTTKKVANTVYDFLARLKPDIAENFQQTIFDNFASNRKIYVYIDDIDRGWKATPKDVLQISALLNAIRDLGNAENGIFVRIAIRTDVYFLVRTSDESMDKILRNIIWLTWNNHDILCLTSYRISKVLGLGFEYEEIHKWHQADISKNILGHIIDEKFQGEGHWGNRPIHNVLLALTRARPRDLILLLHGAAKNAYRNNHDKISTRDLEAAFPQYSADRLQDLINEFKSEMPKIKDVLLQFRPTKKKGGKLSGTFLYHRDEIVLKIKNIKQHVSVLFTSGIAPNDVDILFFLYKIDFLQARKELEGGKIERRNFDQGQFLINASTDFGFDMEVHPAYRWALQPTDMQDVINSIMLNS